MIGGFFRLRGLAVGGTAAALASLSRWMEKSSGIGSHSLNAAVNGKPPFC